MVTYAAAPVRSTVDHIIVRQENQAKVCNVKVISNEECVPKHKLLVMDMQFNTTNPNPNPLPMTMTFNSSELGS